MSAKRLVKGPDGTYAELTLSVVATTRVGQTVHVTRLPPHLEERINVRKFAAGAQLLQEASQLVTTPQEWPSWKTAKPLIVCRNSAYKYCYSIVDGCNLVEAEASARVVHITTNEAHVSDVFGRIADERIAETPENKALCSTNAMSTPAVKPAPVQSQSARIYIACFHLPVRLFRDAVLGKWTATWGESLIARRDGSVANDLGTHWIGTVFAASNQVESAICDEHDQIRRALAPLNCTPLFFAESTRDLAYLGYCKQILWPSFHNVDIVDLTCACWKPNYGDPAFVWDQAATEHWWDAYVSLNHRFYQALSDWICDGDIVWVHDYHLMLLPNMLTADMDRTYGVHLSQHRRAHIIFFLHIPFPTSQIFRSLTRGPELLEGMVGADVLGFHAFDHARHFLNACKRLMGLSHQSVRGGLTGVEYLGRTVTVVVRHVSIEPREIATILNDHEFPHPPDMLSASVTKDTSTRAVFASIDSCQRLSGLALKFLAFERFLWDFERWRGRVILVQLAIREGKRLADESRTSSEIRKLVVRINTAFPGAICYRELAPPDVTLRDRICLWGRATTLVGTAIREGLSLAPFEYIFTRQRPLAAGLVLASEFSATASLLNGALRLNPFDSASLAAAFDCAMSMPDEERSGRHARDLPYVLSRPSGQWTRGILHDMWQVSSSAMSMSSLDGHGHTFGGQVIRDSPTNRSIPLDCTQLKWHSERTIRKVVLLHLGGTLVEKGERVGKYLKPNLHRPSSMHKSSILTEASIRLLKKLSESESTTVSVVTGVTMSALTMTLGQIPHLGLAASNGLYFSHACRLDNNRVSSIPRVAAHRRTWTIHDYSINWRSVEKTMLPILKWFTARTNGSSIIGRDHGMAWSYYRTDPEWGRIQANQLLTALSVLLSPYDVVASHAEGIIEIVPRRLQKSAVVRDVLATNRELHGETLDVIVCVGDDACDEEMFGSAHSFLADHSPLRSSKVVTRTVGDNPLLAAFYCTDHDEVTCALHALTLRTPATIDSI
mmetsp:Transcript_18679/g.58732  ORF Transcript_18679/g.58732 Transcript_18679/m.58732 type:complete len:1008 (-) Transcript_18679:735-3758(-)|eukprot:CAMPEP_0197411026 /NCGR_PEP_ID=MMETSP1165-20131217/31750_1 /TAXON_ID=284809 /ORGANISM="Chrysocystis fragilis, Strain CCMP3189" /LENGTH=1007 /DNA_ID=CAMNT_0042937537 /DNA_START=224 /DNA_END=3247 /DNA_ORIENTATION=-